MHLYLGKMIKMDDKIIYAKAIEIGGADLQFRMSIEECLEMALAICHLYRGRADTSNLAEEVADVEIMCGQVRLMIGDDIVDKAKKRKLEKLWCRIHDNKMVNQEGTEGKWPTNLNQDD